MSRIALALLVVVVVWTVHLTASYYLAWAACPADDGWRLAVRHLTTIVALGIALAATQQMVRATRSGVVAVPADQPADERPAERGYLASVAIALSIMFVLGIVLAGAGNLFLVPCV